MESSALDYLNAHNVMTVATNGPDGVWAAAVFYANEQFTLYFLSAERTRHAQNFLHQPHIAATIQEDYEDWPQIKGIQLEGMVKKLDGTAQQKAITLYEAKYPFLATAEPPVRRAMQRVNWYQLTPTRLYFIDNSLGFGHRSQIIGA